MSEAAAPLSQPTSGSTQPPSDPALAAIRLARASLDALVLRMGEPIEARVVGLLAGGLTQLASGNDAFVLKLPAPLPIGVTVTIQARPAPDGQPAVTVRLGAAPLPAPAPAGGVANPLPANLFAARSSLPAPAAPAVVPPQSVPQPVAAGPVEPAPLTTTPLRPAPVVPAGPAPVAAPPAAGSSPASPPAVPVQGAVGSVIASAPPLSIPGAAAPLVVAVPVVPNGVPVASAAMLPAVASTAPTLAAATALQPTAAPTPALSEVGVRPIGASPLPSSAVTVAASIPRAASPSAGAVKPASAAPLPQLAPAMASQASTPAPQAPVASPAAPLNLADLGQVAARQDSMAPLLARLAAALVQGAALPRPVVEAAVGLLGRRIDLNRAPPVGTALRDAVLASGVLADAKGSRAGVRDSLLQLRAGLLAVLGGDGDAALPEGRRPVMPLRGEPPRAAPAQAAAGPAPALPELARDLFGHTDAALSRLKLLQVASQPPDSARSDAQPVRPELRVEIPLLLGAETAMLQLQVERDARHRPTRRERAWRMRFAVHFSATGEIGAEVALFGRTANVSVWAAEAETAEAIEAMLPELSPALARHGLEVGAVRVRRGVPATRPRHPGRLVDNAR